MVASSNEIVYLKCPICFQTMDRRAFSEVSAIVVNDCVQHGVFGDAGWLGLAAAFISHGGEVLVLQDNLEGQNQRSAVLRGRLREAEMRANAAAASVVPIIVPL